MKHNEYVADKGYWHAGKQKFLKSRIRESKMQFNNTRSTYNIIVLDDVKKHIESLIKDKNEIDKYLLICSKLLLTYNYSNIETDWYEKKYREIASDFLIKTLGKHYKKYIEFLIANNLIVANTTSTINKKTNKIVNSYSARKKESIESAFTPTNFFCCNYKLVSNSQDIFSVKKGLVEYTITNKKLIEKLEYFDSYKDSLLESLEAGTNSNYNFLIDNVKNTYSIINQDVIDKLEESEGRYRACDMLNFLYQINNQNFHFSIDEYGYRFHSNYTRMYKECRPYIRFKDVDSFTDLKSIDISNSQFFFLSIINYKTDFEEGALLHEFREYKDIFEVFYKKKEFVSLMQEMRKGLLYDSITKSFLGQKIKLENGSEMLFRGDVKENSKAYYEYRAIIKRQLIKLFFCSSVQLKAFSVIKSNFRSPVFEEFFNFLKFFDYVNEEGKTKNKITMLLQRYESKVLLNDFISKVREAGVKHIISLHDGFIVTEDDINIVEQCLLDTFKNINSKLVLIQGRNYKIENL